MKRCPQCYRIENDDALAFCRADGTALVIDSASLDNAERTAQLESPADVSEVHTSILPHRTDAHMSRLTAPTTVLPAPSAPLSTPAAVAPLHQKKLVIAIASAILLGLAAAGYLFVASRNKGAIQSIAVMPFVNEGGNADVEYLSDGMTETLINSLSQLPNLSVKARSSVFRYKGKDIDPKKLASELGVEAVLTGRISQRGNQVTLNVELIDARTENALWGNKYERSSAELVALQSEVARDVSTKLKSTLSGADEARVTKKYTANPEAYQFYLKGRFYWNKRTVDGLKQAAAYLQQAVEKDPGYALAYSALADTYVLFSAYSVASPKDSMPKAKAAALKAIELDSSLAEPHATIGAYYSGYEYNLKAAEDELKRAIQLNPNYPTAYHWLALILVPLRKNDEAIATARRAEQLDPLSAIISADTAFDFFLLHRYDDAIQQAQHTLTIDPNFYYAHYLMGKAYNQKGMYKEAVSTLRRAVELNADPIARATLAQSLALSGQRAEAMKLLEELKADSTHSYIPNYFLATAYLALGDRDTALALLEKDADERCVYLQWMAVDPELDGLRNDPRFAALLQKVGVGVK